MKGIVRIVIVTNAPTTFYEHKVDQKPDQDDHEEKHWFQ